MLDYRSPSFLFSLGGAAFTVSIVAWLIGGESAFSWAFMLAAVPPVFELEMTRSAAQIGAMIYSRDADDIERVAYKPLGSLLRCGAMLIFLSSAFLLGRGGLDVIPDNGWAVLLILGPFVAYVLWGGLAYWITISETAKRETWRKRRAR